MSGREAVPLHVRVPDRTKLLVGRYEPLTWWWAVVRPDGYVVTDGIRKTHATALEVGLAALGEELMLDLQAELDELERTDPDVRAAADSYDRMVERVTGRTLPPRPAEGEQP